MGQCKWTIWLSVLSGLREAKTVSKAVYLYGFVFITVNSLLVVFLCYVTDSATHRTLIYYAVMNSILAYLIILMSVFVRRHSTVECICSASLRYCMSAPSTKSCSLIFLVLVYYNIIFLCGNILSWFLYESNVLNYLFFLLFEFQFLPLFATSLLLSSLCLIAERVFIYINDQLREISNMRHPAKTISQIEILMFYHEVVTDFVEEINICFSYDLVALLLDFTHQLIFCSYTVTFSSQSNINFILIQILLYSVHLLKFVMVCSCSQRIHKQVM